MPSAGLRRDERGFSLVELLVTMLILVVGVMGTVALIDGANATTAVTAQREAGNALVREVLEDARSVPYAKLTPGGIVTQLQSVSGLGDIDPDLAWKVKRRNVEYTLSATVCSVDDGKDLFGDHGTGNFCAGPETTGSPNDRSPDDYKRVRVTATWKRPGGASTRDVSQSALISNESNTQGPDLNFVSQNPGGLGATVIDDDSVDRVIFGVQTSEPAAAVKYLVDGVASFTDSPNGTNSSFSWRIDGGPEGHLPDGTYVISATAYDDDGHAGPTRSRTLRLNRDEPLAPTEFRGGWNALRDVVDLEWNRNSEPDVIGYRVYRVDGSDTRVICEYINQARKTDCIDSNPPSSGTWSYYVRALDENPFTGEPREGASSTVLTVSPSTSQPDPPPTLSASLSNGDVILDWTVPAGDVAFYRIYRDGTAIADRVGIRAPGTATSYNDGPDGGHRYWVTAVDSNFSESTPVGPVQP